ncbi:MAG TPA: PepSY-associated TM helix domain-containing protein [Bryobacteraceae bacterium]|nr:PepSY-associated TM helix domain-containing protein [Bryobacteraceae bacterium]
MTLRKLIFWPHLIAGTIAGTVVLIMSLTGVLLMYEKQMITWADEREYKIAPPAGAERQPIETLIAAVREGKKGTPSAVTLRSDPNAPVMFAFGRGGNVYVNPYTAEVLGNGSPGLRKFFHVVTDWHRWLGAHGDKRPMGRAITGASNLAFLFLVVSGFYLWWPKKWTRQHLKPVTLFRGGLSGKARDFNWHNVIGFWCAVPLFFVVLGATVISYPWASNMVYRVTGSEPPKLQGPPGGRGPGGPGGPERPPGGPGGRSEISVEKLNDAWAVAQRQVSGWRAITLRLPPSARAPLTFTIDQGYGGQPQKRTTLTINRETSDVVKTELFSSLDAGRRARTWLRFVHTGEYYGLTGQTIAGVASAGAVVLVWTGIALSLRRFQSWRSRKRVRAEVLVTR